MNKIVKWARFFHNLAAAFFCYQCVKYALVGNVGIVVASFCTMLFIRSSEVYLSMAMDYRKLTREWREAAHDTAQQLMEERKAKEESQ
jgi:hypothetical protein